MVSRILLSQSPTTTTWSTPTPKLWKELTRVPNLWETKKIEKTHAKEKQSHAQDNIYVIRSFAYVHRIVGISLLSGKNTKCGYSFFTLSQDNNNNKILITKKDFYILHTWFTNGLENGLGGLSMSSPAYACWPKPPLHELSLRKSPIKNHATLFQVRSSTVSNTN